MILVLGSGRTGLSVCCRFFLSCRMEKSCVEREIKVSREWSHMADKLESAVVLDLHVNHSCCLLSA